MSAAVATERTPERSTAHREVYCPDCRRYLAATTTGPLPVGLVWLRLYCRTCGRWHWYDAATGQRRAGNLTKRAPS